MSEMLIKIGRLMSKNDMAVLDAAIREMLAPVNSSSQPNLGTLALRLRNIELMSLNIKYFGFELARRLADQIPPRSGTVYAPVGLASKPSTQADLESDWAAHWCAELRVPVAFHRKLWEFVYCLQALAENGMLEPGHRGVGFGCGEEPLASYLAARGVLTTVTDLSADDSAAAGWRSGSASSTMAMAFSSSTNSLRTRPINAFLNSDRHSNGTAHVASRLSTASLSSVLSPWT